MGASAGIDGGGAVDPPAASVEQQLRLLKHCTDFTGPLFLNKPNIRNCQGLR